MNGITTSQSRRSLTPRYATARSKTKNDENAKTQSLPVLRIGGKPTGRCKRAEIQPVVAGHVQQRTVPSMEARSVAGKSGSRMEQKGRRPPTCDSRRSQGHSAVRISKWLCCVERPGAPVLDARSDMPAVLPTGSAARPQRESRKSTRSLQQAVRRMRASQAAQR
jgi:hypothetical protein